MRMIEQLMRGLGVLLILSGGVMLFVATDHAIQQMYRRHSVEDELERRRARELPRKEERR